MAIITTGNSFNPTDTVTSAELNNIANAATFDDPVDGTSLELKLDGKLGVKDAGVTPAKLSTGAPSWNASGAFLTSNVTAPESANSLILRSDPETPGTGLDGGSQIRLFSSDSDFPDQVYYRGDFHTFNNIAGDLQGSISYDGIPTLAQHFTRKDYVDGLVVFSKSFESPEQAIPSAGTDVIVAHGLGVAPKLVQMKLRCVVAQFGYDIGDEVYMTSFDNSGVGTLNVWSNATNVGYRTASGNQRFARRDANSSFTPGTNWRIVFVVNA